MATSFVGLRTDNGTPRESTRTAVRGGVRQAAHNELNQPEEYGTYTQRIGPIPSLFNLGSEASVRR